MSEVRLLTSKEVAAKIGVVESYLRQCRMTGTIGGGYPSPPYRQMGRSIRYLESELEEWMQSIPKRIFLSTAEIQNSVGTKGKQEKQKKNDTKSPRIKKKSK